MYPQLATNDSTTLAAPAQLFAGEAPITTNRAEGGSEVNLAQYTVVALVADKIVPFDWYAADGSEKAAGILANTLNTKAAGGTPGAWAPYYTGGDFNHAALLWPVRVSTPVKTGTGNGTMSAVTSDASAPVETWTVTCTAAAANGGTFSVVGSVSGAKASATVGVAYDNGLVGFTINDGATDFIVGDKFEFTTAAPSLAEKRAAFAQTSTIKISKVL